MEHGMANKSYVALSYALNNDLLYQKNKQL
jgi:hypothetical protein